MKRFLLVASIILFLFCQSNETQAQSNQTVSNGSNTTAFNFAGSACQYNWTNNTPGIGLPASGTGNIPSFTAVNNGASPVTATIMATSALAGYAYIPNSSSDNVSVINLANNLVVTTIPVGNSPLGVSISPDQTLVYITNQGSNSISVISTASNSVIATIATGTNTFPSGIVVSPDGSRVYTANHNNNTLSVINTATNLLANTINVGTNPYGIAISPDGQWVYVANSTDNTISVISTATNTLVSTVPVGISPNGLCVSADGSKVYVTNFNSNTISVVSTPANLVTNTFSVGLGPADAILNASGTILYVTNLNNNTVSAINTSTGSLISTIIVGVQPNGLSLSPDGSRLYVTNINTGGVSVINTSTNLAIGTVAVGPVPLAVGNFISGAACAPVTFTITINSTAPAIIAGAVTGNISACIGSASASPLIQQFTVSGSGLTADIVATAPSGFEISLTAGTGYGNSVTLTQTGGSVNNTILYARSAASDPAGNISGNVTLTSSGISSQTVAVSGMINPLPVVNPVSNQTVANGAQTTAVNFTGTANIFNWVNDTPGIGLASSGNGDIAPFRAVNNTGTSVTATITVTPASGEFAYITNYSNGTVSVINVATNLVVATITVGNGPFGISVSSDGSRVYVTNRTDNTVSVISTSTNTVIATVNVGTFPWGVSVSPNNKYVYVTNSLDNTVSVIDASTNTVIATVSVGNEPIGVTVSPDGSLVYVANYFQGTISVISAATNTVVSTISVTRYLDGIVVSPDGSRIYVTEAESGAVYIIDAKTNTVISSAKAGSECLSLAISPDGSTVYTANQAENTVSVINAITGQSISTISTGLSPTGISVSADGKWLYVTNQAENDVSVINASTGVTVTSIPVGPLPISFGNFISIGSGCSGTPVTFTITVTQALPAITAGAVTGDISACEGSPSASPLIQQFTASGNGLTSDIIAAAPPGFEISLTPGAGYSSSITLTQTGGIVNNKTIYVRSAASDPAGYVSGNVSLTSNGVTSQNVFVWGNVVSTPVVSAVSSQTVLNGAQTAAVNFTGTANTFNWINNTPGIGLPSSGTGNISPFTAVNTGSTPIMATVTVTPQSVPLAYISNYDGGSVSVINTLTNTGMLTIPLQLGVTGMAVSPDGSKVYVANPLYGTISVINTMTNVVINTIPNVDGANGLAISPTGDKLYVTSEINGVGGAIFVINTATNTILSKIGVNSGPYGIVLSPDGSKLYMTNPSQGTISILNTITGTLTVSISVVLNPTGVALSPDGGLLYVTNFYSNSVSVINTSTNTVLYNIPVGQNPTGISANPDGKTVYVANQNLTSNSVSVISTAINTVIATVAVGSTPTAVQITPDGSTVYVTNDFDGTVSVINTATNTVIVTIPVGAGPISYGNSITAGSLCGGQPITFNIIVNPVQAITASAVTGNISACIGSASANPLIQQFTVSGSGLTADIVATAPPGFEISLIAGTGYNNSVTLTQTGGSVNNTILYVRSAASDPAGNISGNVVLTSSGIPPQTVVVSGIINPLAIVNPVANQTVANGAQTTVVNFTGTANTFNWVNDTPGIGLPASGIGDILSFNAINTSNNLITAIVTVTPVSGSGCTGTSITFTITVNQTLPSVISSSGIPSAVNTTYGTPSTSTGFNVSGTNMAAGILVTPPAGFEVSTDNINFSGTVTVGSLGAIASTAIYIRLASNTSVGSYSGNIVLSSAGAASVNIAVPNSTVTPAQLIISVADVNKTYGKTLNGVQGSTNFKATGLQNNETVGSITITYGMGSASTAIVATYNKTGVPSAASGGTFSSSNYTITYNPGNIVVTTAILTINADNQSKIAGSPNPVLTATYHGFVNNEGPTQLIALPVLTTSASTTSAIGNYPIIASGAVSDNYTFNYVQGVLNILPNDATIKIPNAFTPNGDGINDLWDINGLADYPLCTVSIFTRYGTLIYQSTGYPKPWDGTYKGSQLPQGVYYYVIDLKNNTTPFSGSITILR